MLPAYKKVLFPALVLPEPSRDLAALAAGFVCDITLLMNRLGDVRVVPLTQDPRHRASSRLPRTMPLGDEGLVRMARAHRADFVVTGYLALLADAFSGEVVLRGADGDAIWTDALEIPDGAVSEARLVLAANLIEAATGARKDVRRARLGSTRSLQAYKRVCLARFHGLDPTKRLQVLDEALKIDPDYADARVLLADTLEKQGKRSRARKMLAVVASQHPALSWGRQRYGVALRVAGYPEQAVEEVQAALDGDPDGVTLFHAGLFAEAGGDAVTAATLYDRAVERGCIDPVLCDKLGRLKANAGQLPEAIALWERARELDSGFDHLLGNLALAHHHRGDARRAEALFQSALSLAPDAFTTHANRAVWLQDRGRHPEAIDACTRAMAIRPKQALLFNNRGVSRLAVGDAAGAREDFEVAMSLDPDPELRAFLAANLARLDPPDSRLLEAHRLLESGAAAVQEEEPRRGIPLLLESLDLHPGCAEAWIFLAIAYRQERLWEQAADALGQALSLDAENVDALGERALALLALGRSEEALDHAKLAAQLRPDDAPALCNLALVQMECGRYEESGDSLATAADLDPSDPIIPACQRELRRRRRKDPRWGEEAWS
jgi:tetratricopeptide (TPR) repeat protein